MALCQNVGEMMCDVSFLAIVTAIDVKPIEVDTSWFKEYSEEIIERIKNNEYCLKI